MNEDLSSDEGTPPSPDREPADDWGQDAGKLQFVPKQREEFIGTEDQRVALYAAYIVAQGQFPDIPKNKTAKIVHRAKGGEPGGQHSFKYADLAAVLKSIRKPLADNGLGIFQPPIDQRGALWIKTMLVHSAGGRLEIELQIPFTAAQVDPKEMAGVISYWRRYIVNGLFCLAADDDLDDHEQEEISDDLIVNAYNAATYGTAEWKAFQRGCTAKQRSQLMSRVPILEERAAEADKNPPAP